MRFSPFDAFDHLKESLCSYLETAYKISDRSLFTERGHRLREEPTALSTPSVAQDPFIESTPSFPGSAFLADLIPQLGGVPPELADLSAFGMPTREFPLYDHQVDALKRVLVDGQHLVVATGTASGKTEIFLLAILGSLLREALTWSQPIRPAAAGTYNDAQHQWLHRRLHERRSPALRAIILYPMNALVNDQLQRLRRVLASPASEQWQQAKLNSNRLYFGMYTGDTEPTGHWSNPGRRARWDRYVAGITATWNSLTTEHQQRGTWPRADGPEMLSRWDMQLAPPDILVTNYSMLEYMLVRPIEAGVFDATRDWLRADANARLTLVVDEAHTYTGARGTEIAYLIRRLKERLGIRDGDRRFSCIATSASLPAAPQSRRDICDFAANLFGEPVDKFHPIVVQLQGQPSTYTPTVVELNAFATFGRSFSGDAPWDAIDELSKALYSRPADRTGEPSVALYGMLSQMPLMLQARALTARNAVQLETLSKALWGDLGGTADRRLATTGVFAAGSYARERDIVDAPPLISSRVHMMFRGIPGLWACMDPRCPQVAESFAARGTAQRPT